jgi:hypothetical protein
MIGVMVVLMGNGSLRWRDYNPISLLASPIRRWTVLEGRFPRLRGLQGRFSYPEGSPEP